MRKIVLITSSAVLAGVLVPGASAAAPAVPCLRQAADQVEIGWWSGGRGHTDDLVVAANSPCRDINVRSVTDIATGKPACRKLRVKWSNGKTTSWRRVCKSWAVVARGAKEGRSYVIEAQGRPASLSVRS